MIAPCPTKSFPGIWIAFLIISKSFTK
jgi:hypothetical protein